MFRFKYILLTILICMLSNQAKASPITPGQINSAKASGSLNQAWITSSPGFKQPIYEAFASSCYPNTISIFSSQNSNISYTYPSFLGNINAFACYSYEYGVNILYLTTNLDSLATYQPHTIGTKLPRISFSGITGTRILPTAYIDPYQPLNNADVYKDMPIVGFEQYPVGADLCEGGCTVSLAAYNSGQRNIAAALANDANGPQLPAGGFSDVEPALFPAALGGGDVSSKGVELQANIGQVFGVAVSTNLYRAMQVAQGINFSADANFNPDLAPNITSSQYAAIVDNDNASIYKQDWSTLIGAAGIGKKVILARRLPISGAQAASNAYFLKTPCTDALSGSLSPATASDSSATFTVRESLNEYHVKSVLTRASTSGEFAIGVISLTSDWRTEPTIFNIPYNQYRWLKLNSVHPESGDINSARLKTKLGDYQFYSEGHYFVANTAGDLNSYPVRILNEINSRLNLQTNAYNTPSIYQTTNNLPRGVLINPACAAINGCALKFIHKGSANGNSCAPIKLLF